MPSQIDAVPRHHHDGGHEHGADERHLIRREAHRVQDSREDTADGTIHVQGVSGCAAPPALLRCSKLAIRFRVTQGQALFSRLAR